VPAALADARDRLRHPHRVRVAVPRAHGVSSVARFLLPLLLLALAGCTVGPDYEPLRPAVAETWLEPAARGDVDSRWWDSFGDPQLSRLIERALASSPDLREAEARLAEARANRDAARDG